MAQNAQTAPGDAGAASPKKPASKTDRKGDQDAAHEALNAGASAQDAVAQAGATMWENSISFGAEAARFAARRADRYREYYEDLACCRNPAEAGQAAARAAQTAMQDYLDEFRRMGQITASGGSGASKADTPSQT